LINTNNKDTSVGPKFNLEKEHEEEGVQSVGGTESSLIEVNDKMTNGKDDGGGDQQVGGL